MNDFLLQLKDYLPQSLVDLLSVFDNDDDSTCNNYGGMEFDNNNDSLWSKFNYNQLINMLNHNDGENDSEAERFSPCLF